MIRFVGIDPSTETGFVAIDINGLVIIQKTLSGIGDIDPLRISTLVDEVREHLRRSDRVCIEGLAMGFRPEKSQSITLQAGIHWAIRVMMFKGLEFNHDVISPNTLKKRVGVTGFKDERDPDTGRKIRLKGKNEKKNAVIAGTEAAFGMSFTNDNVNDAFVLAHIARDKYLKGAKK